MRKDIENFLEHVASVGSYSEGTLRAYRFELTRFLEFSGDVAPERVGASDLRLYEMKIAKTNSTAGRRRAFAALATFFKWLLREGRVKSDPLERMDRRSLDRPPSERRSPRHLVASEISMLTEAVEQVAFAPRRARDLAIVGLMLHAGARLSEIAELSRKDVDLKAGSIDLGRGKARRKVPLNAHLRETLFRQLTDVAIQEDTPLFSNNRGGRLTKDGVYYLVKRYLRAAGIVEEKSKASPQTLRQTFCTQLLLRGASVAVVQELAGYASLGAAVLDVDVPPVDTEAAVELLDDLV